MVWRRDYNCIHLVELQQILEIREHIGNLETLGDRACFRAVVIAQRDELGALDFAQRRKVRELRNRADANETESNGSRTPGLFSLRFCHWSYPGSRSSESYDNPDRRVRGRSPPTDTYRSRVRSRGR